MQSVLGPEPLITNGGILSIQELCKTQLIGLYFTAHWCPPCRIFTPKLVKVYNKANAASKVLEIVFVSFDRTSEVMTDYFEEMPWTSIPIEEQQRRSLIAKNFEIVMVPELIIFSSDGTLISRKGREELELHSFDCIEFWLSKLNSNITGEIEEEISDYTTEPVAGLICDNGHFLTWKGDVGKYYSQVFGSSSIGCNYCNGTLNKSSWHCRDCCFDLCKDCRDWKVNSPKVNDPSLKCLNLHDLRRSISINVFYNNKYGLNDYKCRCCETLLNGNNLHCRRCLVDICEKCENTIVKFSTSCQEIKCNNGHGLVWTPEICNIYKNAYGCTAYSCDICRIQFQGAGCFHCSLCNYDCCINCIRNLASNRKNN